MSKFNLYNTEMEKKVEVLVCYGTLCHLMGGSDLQLLGELLPLDLQGKVDLKGAPCLNFCNEVDNGKPPFAVVNGRKIEQATVKKLIQEIRVELEKK